MGGSKKRAFAVLALVATAPSAASAGEYDPRDVYARMQEAYAQLKSYADVGSIATDYEAAGGTDAQSYAVTTAFRRPRQFIFSTVRATDSERFVIWVDTGDFKTYWSASQDTEDYPQGQGGSAFAIGSEPTEGTIVTIPALLFADAGLHGPLTDLGDLKASGYEDVTGHRCYKIDGTIASAYGTGAVTGVRAATVWIDEETLLVRKLFEDTPKDTQAGVTDQVVMTFEPNANPDLADNPFNFVPPQ